MDRETVLALAKNGFEELKSLDPSFTEFQRLFKSSHLDRDRGLLTAEQNGELTLLLNDLLRRLSPYFPLRPTQKIFEWLITIHKVNHYNLTALLECVLPYYNTNLFVRVLQLLPLADKRSEWHWLKTVQKSQMSLSPLSLVQHAISAPDFLNFICQLFINSIPTSSAAVPTVPAVTAVNFYVSTLVQVVTREHLLEESILQTMLTSVTLALKSQAEDVIAAGLIVTAYLSTNCILSANLCGPLVRMVSKAPSSLMKECIGCLAILADTQPNFKLTSKSLKSLGNHPESIEVLATLERSYRTDKLSICLLKHFIERRAQCEDGESATYILKSMQFDAATVNTIFVLITHNYFRAIQEENGTPVSCESMVELGRILVNRYPAVVKEVVERMQLEYQGTGDEKNNFQSFLLDVYLNWSLDDTNGIYSENKLFLSLNHATSNTRRAAVLKIREQLTESSLETVNVEFVRSSLLERIGDEDPEVVQAVLETGTPLFSLIRPTQLADTLLDLCLSGLDRHNSKNLRSCVLASLRLICSDKFITSAPHTINAVTLVLIELMFLRAPVIKLNTQVMNLFTEWTNSHFPLLDSVSELITRKNAINFDRNSSVKLLLSFNVSLLNTIAGNISHMDRTSFECFIDYLISSLHSNKHSLISLSLLGITLHSLEQSDYLYVCKIASSYLQLITGTEHLFESLTADYGDTKSEVITKIQNILYDSTCNPNSQFVKRYAISRLSLWTMSAIITGLPASHSSCPVSFWSEDLSEIDVSLRVVFSLFSLLIELDLSCSSLRMAYKQILQQLLSLHLSDCMLLSTCVANVITLPESASSWHRNITLRTKIYALQMFNSFIGSLQNTPGFACVDKLSHSSPIIPALLVQLVSPNKAIRHTSLECLSAMCLQSHHPYQSLVSSLLDRSTDIRSNREFSTRVLSQLSTGSIQVRKRRSTRLTQTQAEELHPLDPILLQLTNNSTPNHITSLFSSLLHSIDSVHAFPAMCTLLERCLNHRSTFGEYHSGIIGKLIDTYTPTTAILLTSEHKGTKLLSELLLSDLKQLHSNLIQRITSHFFESLSDETQLTLLSLLFTVLTNDTGQYLDSTKVTARNIICNITLNPTHINQVITQNAGVELIRIDTEIRPSPAKKKKTPDKSTEKDKLSPKRSNQILSTLFELLLKCQLSNIEALIPQCFLLLSVLHKWRDVVDPLSLEYNNNLLFSLMTQLIKSVSPSKLYIFEPTFDVLQIIRTIQSTMNVHVQVQGYLLLSEAARLMPDRTIHNIMPIFTFMGTSIVRNDDGYSFQVILQAIESLVPPLVKVEGIDRPVLSLVTAVLQVFVDAYSHIPSHRRISLYVHLANVLGSSQYLYLLLILLILKATADQSGATGRISFAKSMLANFGMSVQLCSLVGIARFLDMLVSENREASQSKEYSEETALLENVSGEQASELATRAIQLVTSYVSNKQFVQNVETARNESIAVDDYFSEIIELGLHYYEKSESEQNNRQVVLLENVFSLLTVQRFVEVFKRMPDHFECTTVDRMLQVLTTKLDNWHERDQLSSHNDLIELSPLLITLSCEQQSSVSGRKLALRALKLIIQVLGPTALDRFRKLVKKLIRSVQSDCECQQFEVIGDKLLVMVELIGILNIQIVPKLPSLVPYMMELYYSSIEENIQGDTSAGGCISVFIKLLRHLANFLNPYLPGLVSLSIDHSSISEREELTGLLASVRASIAQHVSFRILLSTAISLIADLTTDASKLTNLLSILEESLLVVDKSELVASHTTLNELLKHTLDLRVNSTTQSEVSVSQVEEACAGVYVNFVLKLSERAFKPLYLQMREWATNEDSASQRLIPFYLLSQRLASKLKSIFSIYLIYFVENAVEVLNRTHSDAEEDNKLFPEDQNQGCTLLKHVLKCVETCLKFDQEHILTREYFDLLKHPLTSQLTNCTGGSEAYQERMANYLIPCLTQFALRADQEGMRKELTLEILIISKNSSPRVRFATLLTLDSLFKLLKEAFLQVLPDSVPYLAELLEDESAEVEQQCQVVIATIEDILGDSIQQYF